jgi:hypothetical protein
MIIIEQILKKIKGIKKPLTKFLSDIVITIFSTQGKINFRNLSRYSDYHEKTISRNFKASKVNFPDLNENLIKRVSMEESIMAVDASFIKKSGKNTYGIGKFWDGKNSKSEKGLEISALAIIDVKDNTAYAVDIKQTPSKLDTDKSRVDFYTKQIVDNKDILTEAKHIVGDGYYTKIKFVNGVIESGRNYVGKLRKDANLKYYYYGKKTGKKGKPKTYLGKVDLSKPDFDYVCDLEDDYKLYTKIVYSVILKRKIKLAYKTNGKTSHIYFSTDLELSAQKIHQYYQKRYQIEYLFRDSKNHLGLEDCMSTDEKVLSFHFNISMTALNFAKVDDKMNRNERTPFSIINYKRRIHNEKMLKLFIFKFALDPNFAINQNEYLELLNFGTISA